MAFLTILAVPLQMALDAVLGGAAGAARLDLAAVRRAYAALPLAFEANRGQVASAAGFVARGSGYSFLVGAQGATLSFTPGGMRRTEGREAAGPAPPRRSMRIDLVGADPHAPAVVGAPVGTTSSFLGADGSRWRTSVPDYERVVFRGVYPGIDLAYHGVQGSLEYDFVVAPGADPRVINLRIDGAPSTLAPSGEVTLALPGGTVVQHPPAIVQPPAPATLRPRPTRVGGRLVPGRRGELRLHVGEYDHARPLLVDPLVTWSPALGGGLDDSFVTAVDRDGGAYVVTATPAPGSATGTDVAALKLDREGRVVYRTFLDGGGAAGPSHLAVDDGGALDISGPELPATGAAELAGAVGPQYTMHLDRHGLPLPRTGAAT